MTLQEKLVAVHDALRKARLPHAFGGAIALAYWTLDPRGTNDIDVNVFVPVADYERVLAALPDEITAPSDTGEKIARDGQARLWWDENPVDVFLDYAAVHADAARNRRMVPFAGATIPVLAPVELAVFKARFDRTKDWADIEAMVERGTLDVDAVRENLLSMVGHQDPRLDRLEEAERRGSATPGPF